MGTREQQLHFMLMRMSVVHGAKLDSIEDDLKSALLASNVSNELAAQNEAGVNSLAIDVMHCKGMLADADDFDELESLNRQTIRLIKRFDSCACIARDIGASCHEIRTKAVNNS